MMESGYYPPGAEHDPSAPYNQVDSPEHDFSITVIQTLSKNLEITTDKYNYTCDEDPDGCYEEFDTSDTDWQEVYEEDHYTPIQLIGILKRILENGEELTESMKKHIIEECNDWCVDDYEIIEES